MARTRLLALASLTAASLAPAVAMAHPGHGVGQNFVAGLLHPLTGLDHLLMIVAVSAWAGAMPRTGRMIVAACLALFVAVGALLPAASAGAPLAAAIALTVLGSGALLAVNRRWPIWASAMLAASFALIHGFAHGAEGPVSSLTYVTGLAVTTGGLALAVSSLTARFQTQRILLRVSGLLGAVAGATLLCT